MEYPDCMIDIETTGTQPESTHMIQLAAVKFNLETGDVDPNVFDKCLLPLPTRFWDEDTRKWWSTMPDVLDGIYARMQDPRQVLERFYEWSQGSENFWGKPTTFDYSFVQSYHRELGVPMQFHFRKTMDQNTFIRSRYFPKTPPALEKELEFVGDAHNALHDALHQVKVVLEAYKRTS